MKKIYDWMMRLAAGPKAPHALAAVSFAESSFFPIPPDVMLVPMVLANRAKAWWFASLATISSVLGGAAGYAIGYFLFQTIGQPILNFYGYTGSLDQVFSWSFDDIQCNDVFAVETRERFLLFDSIAHFCNILKINHTALWRSNDNILDLTCIGKLCFETHRSIH